MDTNLDADVYEEEKDITNVVVYRGVDAVGIMTQCVNYTIPSGRVLTYFVASTPFCPLQAATAAMPFDMRRGRTPAQPLSLIRRTATSSRSIARYRPSAPPPSALILFTII